jgi:dihydrofolate reductase
MSLVLAILAVGPNGEFGTDDVSQHGLPFHSKSDFNWFKDVTKGQRLVMSQKTLDFIPDGLPGREIYINTRQGIRSPHGGFLELGKSNTDVYLAGGKQVYLNHLDKTDIVLLTINNGVNKEASIKFDIEEYLSRGFKIIYSGSTREDISETDVNNLLILSKVRLEQDTGGLSYYIPSSALKAKIYNHFEPYLKLKIKNSIQIQPGSHGEVEISTPVYVPFQQTGILSLRKSLARKGLYTSGITFKNSWRGKPTIIVTNNSHTVVELFAGEEIGEISFVNNRPL